MVRIDPDELAGFAAALLEGTGAPPDHARQVASSLVGADLRGHSSHGVLRVPLYADLVGGNLRPGAEPAVTSREGATARIDGRGAFGQVTGRVAVELLAELAVEHGVGAVGIGGSAHLGRVGEWAERAAGAGLVLVGFVKSRSPMVAPAGGVGRLLSTNPVCVGVPSFGALDHDVVLDMATSQVAHGKIRDAAAAGEAVPPEWTVDADGAPVPDARAFEAGAGAIQPLGGPTSGYKGFGLAAMVELLGGLFGDAPVAGQHDAPPGYNDALFLAADPERFTTAERAAERVAALAAHVAAADYPESVPAGVAAKGDRARLPGAPEHELAEAQRRDGVDLADAVARQLRELAAAQGRLDAVPAAVAELHDGAGLRSTGG